MKRLQLVAALALAACGAPDEDEQTTMNVPGEAAPVPLPAPTDPPTPEEAAALASVDCSTVVQLDGEALADGDHALAARVWDDPVIDVARLEAVYRDYEAPQFEWATPQVEGAAGSLYCTVEGALADAADPSQPPAAGTLVLRRVNDVPGATPDQLRWTIRSSTFVEPMERSGTGGGT